MKEIKNTTHSPLNTFLPDGRRTTEEREREEEEKDLRGSYKNQDGDLDGVTRGREREREGGGLQVGVSGVKGYRGGKRGRPTYRLTLVVRGLRRGSVVSLSHRERDTHFSTCKRETEGETTLPLTAPRRLTLISSFLGSLGGAGGR